MSVVSVDKYRTSPASVRQPFAFLFALVTLLFCQSVFTAQPAVSVWQPGALIDDSPALAHGLISATYSVNKHALKQLLSSADGDGSEAHDVLRPDTSVAPRAVAAAHPSYALVPHSARPSLAHPGAARAPPFSPEHCS